MRGWQGSNLGGPFCANTDRARRRHGRLREVAGRRRISLPDFSVSIVRREDLLSLDFLFSNLALVAGAGAPPQVVRKVPAQPSYLVAQFDAPQNIAEQAYLEAFTDTAGHTPPPGGDKTLFLFPGNRTQYLLFSHHRDRLGDLIDAAARLDETAPILTTNRLRTEITTTLDFTPAVYQDYSDPSGFLHLTFNGDVRASTAGSPRARLDHAAR